MLLLVNPVWSYKQETTSKFSSLLAAYRNVIPNSRYQFVWHGYSWAQYEDRHQLLPPPNTSGSDGSPVLGNSLFHVPDSPRQRNSIQRILPTDLEVNQVNTTG